MGFRKFDDMIGQMQMLDSRRNIRHWKAHGLDFKRLFFKPEAPDGVAIYRCEDQDHELGEILDQTLIKEARPAIDGGRPVQITHAINNTDRSAGKHRSGGAVGEVAKLLDVAPPLITGLFYRRDLQGDRCPIVGGRRLIPADYIEIVAMALRRKGVEVRDPDHTEEASRA